MAGADLNRPHAKSGDTALTIAAFTGKDDVVTALIRAGADVTLTNNQGINALMLASGFSSASTVSTLIKAGASPDAASPDGITALTFAELEGRHETIKLLLTVQRRR